MNPRRITAAAAALVVCLAAAGPATACTRVSAADLRTMQTLGTFVNQWNTTAGRFVYGFLDPKIPRRRWAATAPRHLAGMRRAANGVTRGARTLQNRRLRSLITAAGANYRSSVAAGQRLITAIRRGDSRAAQAAVRKLGQGGQRSSVLGRQIIALARDVCR